MSQSLILWPISTEYFGFISYEVGAENLEALYQNFCMHKFKLRRNLSLPLVLAISLSLPLSFIFFFFFFETMYDGSL